MLLFLWKGALLGLSVAAPVGPIGVLCIRRTLQLGPKHGFLTGMGAATADGLYGLVAGLGLAGVSSILVAHQQWIRLTGGIFLVYLGCTTFRSRPAAAARAGGSNSLLGTYASSLALTVTNPMTILSFAAAFAGLGLGASAGAEGALLLVGGVFIGSALWFLFLSGSVSLFRQRVTDRALLWVNRGSGAIILAFGSIALARFAGSF